MAVPILEIFTSFFPKYDREIKTSDRGGVGYTSLPQSFEDRKTIPERLKNYSFQNTLVQNKLSLRLFGKKEYLFYSFRQLENMI